MVCNEVEASKAVVVLVHGLCEYAGRYDHVTERLCADGYQVYRFDHRGHGRSEGKMTYYSDCMEIGEDVRVVVELAKSENPDKKIYIVGHSMGGHATALYATRYPGMVDGCVLLGAITRQSTAKEGDFPIPLPEDVYLDNEFKEGLCSDPRVLETYLDDPYVKTKISVGLLNRVWEGTNFLREHAAEFVDPVLMLHGCKDGIVSERDSREMYGEISSEDKTLKIYAGLCHELLNEPCKDEIIDEILLWLNRHVG